VLAPHDDEVAAVVRAIGISETEVERAPGLLGEHLLVDRRDEPIWVTSTACSE
jgi:hypothetical protein